MAYFINKLTKRQKEVFEQIAIGNDAGHSGKVLYRLLQRGLIISAEEVLPGRFPVHIKRYFVPTDIHIRWCEWCAKNYKELGIE